jgi:peptidoglycan-associated lipoprotein
MRRRTLCYLPGLLALGISACATTSSVDKKIAEAQAKSDKKIESVETQVEDLQQKQKATDTKLEDQQKSIEQLSQSAKDALQRATEAGVLAKGKVVFQESFTEDRVRFKTSSYELSKDAKAALDEFAARVKELNAPVWIEIQGHTDNTGTAAYNEMLGQQRADSVRRYLAISQKLPLPRMSTISYGDTLPVAPNTTGKGRAENRRVVIVVLE